MSHPHPGIFTTCMATDAGAGKARIEARGANGNPHQPPAKSHDVTWKDGVAEVIQLE